MNLLSNKLLSHCTFYYKKYENNYLQIGNGFNVTTEYIQGLNNFLTDKPRRYKKHSKLISYGKLYRTKSRMTYANQEELAEVEAMIKNLKEFKYNIIMKYLVTYSRSRIVENMLGLIDLISKRIK